MNENRQTTGNLEHAIHTLDTVNLWINNIDTKASYALSIISIVTGFVLVKDIPKAFQTWKSTQVLAFTDAIGLFFVILLYFASLISILCFIIVILARIKPEYESNIFFGTISNTDFDCFKRNYSSMDEAKYYDEVLKQIHINSKICNKKVIFYNYGTYALLIAIFLCFICCIFQLI